MPWLYCPSVFLNKITRNAIGSRVVHRSDTNNNGVAPSHIISAQIPNATDHSTSDFSIRRRYHLCINTTDNIVGEQNALSAIPIVWGPLLSVVNNLSPGGIECPSRLCRFINLYALRWHCRRFRHDPGATERGCRPNRQQWYARVKKNRYFPHFKQRARRVSPSRRRQCVPVVSGRPAEIRSGPKKRYVIFTQFLIAT